MKNNINVINEMKIMVMMKNNDNNEIIM